jgi:hypothetical protein
MEMTKEETPQVTPEQMALALGFDYSQVPEYMTLAGIAQQIGISRQGLSDHVERGSLPGVQFIPAAGTVQKQKGFFRVHRDDWIPWAYARSRRVDGRIHRKGGKRT